MFTELYNGDANKKENVKLLQIFFYKIDTRFVWRFVDAPSRYDSWCWFPAYYTLCIASSVLGFISECVTKNNHLYLRQLLVWMLSKKPLYRPCLIQLVPRQAPIMTALEQTSPPASKFSLMAETNDLASRMDTWAKVTKLYIRHC